MLDPMTKYRMKNSASTLATGMFTGFILGSTMAVTRRVINGGGFGGVRNEALGGGGFFAVLLGIGSLIRH